MMETANNKEYRMNRKHILRNSFKSREDQYQSNCVKTNQIACFTVVII